MRLFDLFEEVDEEIKGWKNAGVDISKARQKKANDGMAVKLVRLKKDGQESKLFDATKAFASPEEAKKRHDRLIELNPGKIVRHNLYVNGKKVHTLDGPSHDVEEVYPGQSSGRLKNYVKKKYGGELSCGKAAKVKASTATKPLKNRASWYQSLHCK